MQFVLNAKTQRREGARSGSDADLRRPRQERHIFSNERRSLCGEYAAPTGLEKIWWLNSTEISLLTELFASRFIREICEICGLISVVTDAFIAPLRLRASALQSLFLIEQLSWQSN
jgi:hypothetical protein